MADNEYPPLIPPGGGGGAPLGPGASIANTLQSILAQRRAEAHSTLMEQMAQQKQSAEISHWQNEDAYNKESREALAEQRRTTAADRKALAENNANVSGYWWDHAYDTDDPILQAAGIAKAQHPERAEQLDQVILNRQLELENKKKPLVGAFTVPYGQNQAKPVMVPAHPPLTGLEQLQVPQGDARELHYDTQPNNPVQPNEANTPHLVAVQSPDPDHPGKMRVETHWSSPTGVFQRPDFNLDRTKSKTFYAIGDVNKPGTPSHTARPPIPLFTQQSLNNLTNSLAKNPASASAAIQGFVSELSNPYIRQDIMDLMGDPNRKALGVEAAVQDLVPPDGIDPEEYRNDFRRVMNIIFATKKITGLKQ